MVYNSARAVGNLVAREALDEVLIGLAEDPSYRKRKTYVSCLAAIIDIHRCNHQLIIDRVIPNLNRVIRDPVIDVRLTLARAVTMICSPG